MDAALYYPNRFVRYLLVAMEEVMGETGLNEARTLARMSADLPPDDLKRVIPFEQLGALNAVLDTMYSQRGGRGMALRAGRAWFVRGMKNFGAFSGMSDPAFRALPREQRCRLALGALAAVFNNFSDQHAQLEETDTNFRLIVDHSPFATDVTADKPVCHPLVGLIQESLRLASNGRDTIVRETHCTAAGDAACVFVITK